MVYTGERVELRCSELFPALPLFFFQPSGPRGGKSLGTTALFATGGHHRTIRFRKLRNHCYFLPSEATSFETFRPRGAKSLGIAALFSLEKPLCLLRICLYGHHH